ncbi:hypothetical protein NL676_002772 [Syzygium grande]|nr:hypothetical protein NL676_002772 [Syzygium grande]
MHMALSLPLSCDGAYVLERRAGRVSIAGEGERRDISGKPGTRVGSSMNFPRGFDLDERVEAWVEQWQDLPYISPYEDAFHLAPCGDQAQKWMVAVRRDLL